MKCRLPSPGNSNPGPEGPALKEVQWAKTTGMRNSRSSLSKKYEKTIGKAVDNCLVANLGKGISQASFEKSIMRLPAE